MTVVKVIHGYNKNLAHASATNGGGIGYKVVGGIEGGLGAYAGLKALYETGREVGGLARGVGGRIVQGLEAVGAPRALAEGIELAPLALA